MLEEEKKVFLKDLSFEISFYVKMAAGGCDIFEMSVLQ